jgi:hypothetical protein
MNALLGTITMSILSSPALKAETKVSLMATTKSTEQLRSPTKGIDQDEARVAERVVVKTDPTGEMPGIGEIQGTDRGLTGEIEREETSQKGVIKGRVRISLMID